MVPWVPSLLSNAANFLVYLGSHGERFSASRGRFAVKQATPHFVQRGYLCRLEMRTKLMAKYGRQYCSIQLILPYIHKVAFNRSRCGHNRTDEVSSSAFALPSFEVAV